MHRSDMKLNANRLTATSFRALQLTDMTRDGVLLRRILLGFVFFSEALHYL